MQTSKTGQVELEDELKREKLRNSELQQRVDQISSALTKEKTTCERHCVELQESAGGKSRKLLQLSRELSTDVEVMGILNSQHHKISQKRNIQKHKVEFLDTQVKHVTDYKSECTSIPGIYTHPEDIFPLSTLFITKSFILFTYSLS